MAFCMFTKWYHTVRYPMIHLPFVHHRHHQTAPQSAGAPTDSSALWRSPRPESSDWCHGRFVEYPVRMCPVKSYEISDLATLPVWVNLLDGQKSLLVLWFYVVFRSPPIGAPNHRIRTMLPGVSYLETSEIL